MGIRGGVDTGALLLVGQRNSGKAPWMGLVAGTWQNSKPGGLRYE